MLSRIVPCLSRFSGTTSSFPVINKVVVVAARVSKINPQLKFQSAILNQRTMASTTVPIPKTMKGILIEKTGGVEVLQYKEDLPVPELKEGEVLVKNDFIGINYIDTYVLSPSLTCSQDLSGISSFPTIQYTCT
jgi:hypothetical protein